MYRGHTFIPWIERADIYFMDRESTHLFSMDGAKILFSHMVEVRIFLLVKSRARKKPAPPQESNCSSLNELSWIYCVNEAIIFNVYLCMCMSTIARVPRLDTFCGYKLYITTLKVFGNDLVLNCTNVGGLSIAT